MGPIVRAIGSGVGLIAEAHASRNKKEAPTATLIISPKKSSGLDPSNAQTNPTKLLRKDVVKSTTEQSAIDGNHLIPKSLDEDCHVESDYIGGSEEEDQWILDEEASKLIAAKEQHNVLGLITVDSLVSMVLSKTDPPPYDIPSNELPVILPQRRPGSKARGFVRAYAPTLNEFGINQNTFLGFIENFDKAIKMSPVLGVVYVGSGIVGCVPNGYAMLASAVTQVVVGAAMEYQQRSRGNSYMDQMNEKLFKPRGLYAVIMTYIPNATRPVTAKPTDLNALIDGTTTNSASWLGASGSKLPKGESYGELELPQSAPLVFPDVDVQKLVNQNALKRGMRFTDEYVDRRHQARWMHNNPNTRLNPCVDGETPVFDSHLADPNHPAFQGSWLTLFSGGRIAPKETRSKKEKRKNVQKGERAKVNNSHNRKRKAKSNILYLMVLPIPSQKELNEIEQKIGGFPVGSSDAPIS